MKIIKSAKPVKAVKFVIRDGKSVLGRGFLYLIKNDLHKRPYGLLEDIFVSKKLRGQGLGTRLIKQMLAEAKKRKCYKIIATSRISNTRVHKLYSRLGFKKHGFEFRINF